MSDKVKCPICGAAIALVPHPEKPDRLVARCSCRGVEVDVYDIPKPIKLWPGDEKKEGEK